MRFVIGNWIAAELFLQTQFCVAAGTDQGAQLAAICASCHCLEGGDQGIRTIIDLDQAKLAGAFSAYRASESPSHIMHAVALSLSDEEIASVVHCLTAQGK